MKAKLIALAVAVVAAVALVASAQAKPTAASNYSCTYKMTSAAVYIRLYGYDNTAYFCRYLSKGWGRRVYLGSFPTRRCTFAYSEATLVISVYSGSARYGRFVCSKLEQGFADTEWVRL